MYNARLFIASQVPRDQCIDLGQITELLDHNECGYYKNTRAHLNFGDTGLYNTAASLQYLFNFPWRNAVTTGIEDIPAASI